MTGSVKEIVRSLDPDMISIPQIVRSETDEPAKRMDGPGREGASQARTNFPVGPGLDGESADGAGAAGRGRDDHAFLVELAPTHLGHVAEGQRDASCGQPCRHCSATSRQHPNPQSQLPRRPVPPPAYQTWCPKAITAMAHRLARLVYRMLKYGQTYVDKGTEYYEERLRQRQIQLLRKRAAKLGFDVVETQA